VSKKRKLGGRSKLQLHNAEKVNYNTGLERDPSTLQNGRLALQHTDKSVILSGRALVSKRRKKKEVGGVKFVES